MRELIQKIITNHQRKKWSKVAPNWESGGAMGLSKVTDELLSVANKLFESTIIDSAADLGCGSGQVTIPLAAKCKKIYAVDISFHMLERLGEIANQKGVFNIVSKVTAIEDAEFEDDSLDLIVSNYALHHLLDSDKKKLIEKAFHWLKPGGYFVLGDMMFGRGSTKRDREIIKSKITTFLRRGPAGVFRILKNIPRFLFRFQERPISVEQWLSLFTNAGYEDVSYKEVVAEAVVMWGRKPSQGAPGQS